MGLRGAELGLGGNGGVLGRAVVLGARRGGGPVSVHLILGDEPLLEQRRVAGHGQVGEGELGVRFAGVRLRAAEVGLDLPEVRRGALEARPGLQDPALGGGGRGLRRFEARSRLLHGRPERGRVEGRQHLALGHLRVVVDVERRDRARHLAADLHHVDGIDGPGLVDRGRDVGVGDGARDVADATPVGGEALEAPRGAGGDRADEEDCDGRPPHPTRRRRHWPPGSEPHRRNVATGASAWRSVASAVSYTYSPFTALTSAWAACAWAVISSTMVPTPAR